MLRKVISQETMQRMRSGCLALLQYCIYDNICLVQERGISISTRLLGDRNALIYGRMLREHGLGSIPGTAAKILDDSVREILSHKKVDVAAWVEIVTTAHECGIRSTSTMMYGHVEAPEHMEMGMLSNLVVRPSQDVTRPAACSAFA